MIIIGVNHFTFIISVVNIIVILKRTIICDVTSHEAIINCIIEVIIVIIIMISIINIIGEELILVLVIALSLTLFKEETHITLRLLHLITFFII